MRAVLAVVSIFFAACFGALLCACPGPTSAGEGEGEGEGGTEGEGELVDASSAWVHEVLGARVELPLDLHGHLPLAAGTVDGTPVVVCAGLVDGVATGGLVIVTDPAGSATFTEVPGVYAGNLQDPVYAVFGDLDNDGDVDVALRIEPTTLIVFANESGVLGLAGTAVLDGRGSGALFDVDADGRTEAVFGGLNGDVAIAHLDGGAPVVEVRSLGAQRVDVLGYCLRSFGVVGGALFAAGDVCAAFDPSLPAPPTGEDRVFRLDDALVPASSAATGLEATDRVFALNNDVVVTGFTFIASPDQSGDLRSIRLDPLLANAAATAAELGSTGAVDLDGDGVQSLLVIPRTGATVPADAIPVDAGAGPFAVDLDGDGHEDYLFARLTVR